MRREYWYWIAAGLATVIAIWQYGHPAIWPSGRINWTINDEYSMQYTPGSPFIDVQVPAIPAPRTVWDMKDGDTGYARLRFHLDGKLCLNAATDLYPTRQEYTSYLVKSNGRLYVWLDVQGAKHLYRTDLARMFCTPVYVTGMYAPTE